MNFIMISLKIRKIDLYSHLLLVIFTLLLCFQKLNCNSNCSTPVECYTKALETLNKDRQEMYRISHKVEQQSEDFKKNVQSMLDEIKKQMETQLITKILE